MVREPTYEEIVAVCQQWVPGFDSMDYDEQTRAMLRAREWLLFERTDPNEINRTTLKAGDASQVTEDER